MITTSENVKREFGVDFGVTLAWVQRKHPEMAAEEQNKFAKNIIRKRQDKASPERYRLSFFSESGGYRRHDDLTKRDAKYYYSRYASYGDVDLEYRESENDEWRECNPACLFDN